MMITRRQLLKAAGAGAVVVAVPTAIAETVLQPAIVSNPPVAAGTWEQQIIDLLKTHVGEINDQTTRRLVGYHCGNILRDHTYDGSLAVPYAIKDDTHNLYEWMLICDERNNPPAIVDNNKLIVDVFYKQLRGAFPAYAKRFVVGPNGVEVTTEIVYV
jgi:hypothetical protein